MRLHLTGGFLGSGKTTAISNACRILSGDGVSPAVIANDQGKYLVDSRYFQSLGIPGTEVTGGCFCCNYNELDAAICKLADSENPSVIFAEAVGSCTDLVATVVKPLMKYNNSGFEEITFSTFVDGRLLITFLKNGDLPFDPNTTYIWQKQIEESSILVVNKADLIAPDEIAFLKARVPEYFSDKIVLFQDSTNDQSVRKWLQVLPQHPANISGKSLEVDYNRYGAGEANLAWLDESVEFFTSDGSAQKVARAFMVAFTHSIASRQIPVGHLKFMLHNNVEAYKFSYTSIDDPIDPEMYVGHPSDHVTLVVNARIQSSPDLVRRTVSQVLNTLRLQHPVNITESNVSFFAPSFPRPTYRLG